MFEILSLVALLFIQSADATESATKPASPASAVTQQTDTPDVSSAVPDIPDSDADPDGDATDTEDSGFAAADEMPAGVDAELIDITTEEVVDDQASSGGGLEAFLTFAFLIGAFVLGIFIANSMKVPDWGPRFGICFVALCLGLLPFVNRMMHGRSLGDGIRYGIDLAGGTNMVFQVKPDSGQKPTAEIMDKMVSAVAKRVNPTGTSEISVVQLGEDRIEVVVPGKDTDTVSDIKRRIVKLGSLEFFVLAKPSEDASIINQAQKLPITEKQLVQKDKEGNNVPYAMWIPAFEEGENREPRRLRAGAEIVRRPVELLRIVDGTKERFMSEEYLVLVEPPIMRVTGKNLRRATPGTDPENGGQIVSFLFDSQGANLFRRMTTRYKPQPGKGNRLLGIALDNKLYSAPAINEPIGAQGVISGDFTAQETGELSAILNAGALEVPIDPKPLSEATVDPTLGEDVRQKGVTAIVVAAVAVVVFMLVYYRFAGIVAVFCLVLNLLLVLSLMATVATFTLPGLAGLVLTIGMAVDANVLIFERMREEVNKGSSLRLAIKNGFGKAFTTIVDANVTTLITAVILYIIGTDLVKGFAVSLFIGIVFSMFTSLYVGRLIFDVAEKQGWIRQLGMFSLVGKTDINFLNKRGLCAVLSLALIVGGMLAFGSRGDGNYDIDFTGGTMVTFQLEESAETEDVGAILEEQFGDTFTIERLSLAGEDGESRHFRLRTTESDSGDASEEAGESDESAEQRVRNMVFESFKDQSDMNLLMVSVSADAVDAFTISEGDESAEALEYARFDGGSQATFSFSDELPLGTIADNLTEELQNIQNADGKSKYDAPAELFDIEGLEGSGMEAVGQTVEKYSKVRVRTTSDLSSDDLTTALGSMEKTFSERPLFDEVNTFSSAVAGEMKSSAILAIIVSLIAIVAYIWFRFQRITFGLAAVAALVHDVLIVLGMMALMSYLSGNPIGKALLLQDFRINLPMVAAFLTIVGYSLNDTIVVFDRIREVRGKNPNLTIDMVNTSLNQTLSRTLLTSLTTFLVVIILYTMGGEGIHGFAFCLTLGVIVGTYSSIYVASPVLVWLMGGKDKS